MKKYDVIIIGAGASGLMCAYFLSKTGKNLKTAILEHKDSAGKKLLATGNGRCNFTNDTIDNESFRGQNPDFAYKVIKKFDKTMLLDCFKDMGIMSININGYYYPRSLQAKTVVNVLCTAVSEAGTDLVFNTEVKNIIKENNSFIIKTDNEDYCAEKVVIATGGKSYKSLGSNGSGYQLSKTLGHEITPLYPALTGLKIAGSIKEKWHGVRAKGHIMLESFDGVVLTESSGEIQFTDYGVSGIPVFQISRYAAKELSLKRKIFAVIDLVPDFGVLSIKENLKRLTENNRYKSISEAVNAYIPEKLANAILNNLGIQIGTKGNKLNTEAFIRIASEMKSLKLTITDTCGFDTAQVTAGGVSTKEINNDTMESVIHNNLYFIGELIDVDGNCGGYNLHFAFASAFVCAGAIVK